MLRHVCVLAVVLAIVAVTATAGADDRVSTSKKGSILIYPKVEIKWDAAGVVTQDTFVSILNDYPAPIFVHMFFVNGDAPLDAVYGGDPETLIERAHPGWNWVNYITMLTQNEPTYFSAVTGLPAGAQPFTALDDEGGILGRLDPDGPTGSRVLRGYVVAYAVDNFGKEVSWNHLSGGATIVNYADQAALEYNAYAAQCLFAHAAQPYDCTEWGDTGCTVSEVIPGNLDMDGYQYDILFDMLLLDFYAVGSEVFSGGGASIMVDTDLTLLPVMMDLTQDTLGPVTTKAHFDIWNENEDSMSGATHCVTCWDQTFLSQHGGTNYFGSNLQTDKGKARIDGVYSTLCGGSMNAPLLGVSWKVLAFSGATTARAYAGSTLVGQGEEAGYIIGDIMRPPGTLLDGPDSDPVGRTLRSAWTPRGK